MIRMALAAVVLVAVAGCGDDGNTHADAAIDVPGGDVAFTGELVDWDETDAMFCGVFQAHLEVHGDPTRTLSTPPNGRVTMMLAPAATTQIDITPPTGMSQCASGIGLYQLPGTAIVTSALLASGKPMSMRMIGMDHLGPFFTGLGVTYDPAKAIVFVHVEGSANPVTSSAAHDTTLAWSGSAWAAGNIGLDVVFPNSAVGTSNIDFSGVTAVGATAVPTAAGTITYVTLGGP